MTNWNLSYNCSCQYDYTITFLFLGVSDISLWLITYCYQNFVDLLVAMEPCWVNCDLVFISMEDSLFLLWPSWIDLESVFFSVVAIWWLSWCDFEAMFVLWGDSSLDFKFLFLSCRGTFMWPSWVNLDLVSILWCVLCAVFSWLEGADWESVERLSGSRTAARAELVFPVSVGGVWSFDLVTSPREKSG